LLPLSLARVRDGDRHDHHWILGLDEVGLAVTRYRSRSGEATKLHPFLVDQARNRSLAGDTVKADETGKAERYEQTRI
jgi:hypothetical protein